MSRGSVPGRIATATLALLAGGLVPAALLPGAQEEPFPHADHQGLFPVCTGCHADMEGDDPAAYYPLASQCTGCHDGVEEEQVTWTAPSPRISNVRFEHGSHAADLAAAGDPPATCESCHSAADGERMSVDGAERLDTCWACHAHAREDHYAGGAALGAGDPAVGVDPEGGDDPAASDCASCHVPLAESGFALERISALELPADHDAPDFLAHGHGSDASEPARCATCHTEDRCASCHVDADRPEIAAIPSAPETMELPIWTVVYPTPADHAEDAFERGHTPGAGGAAECSTCHTSDDCLSCHVEPGPEIVADLPSRAESRAPGVDLDVVPPESHEALFFLALHADLAAADPENCASCHTETYCVACHDGPSDGGYHPLGFVGRHAADGWGRDQECASCHNTAVFCRSCHIDSGFGSRGRLGAGFHDAEPVWLLRHGGPARQNLESCASCHEQSDCVQCHGVLGSFGISPHTPDFDAESAWLRSPRTCIACHTSNPLEGG